MFLHVLWPKVSPQVSENTLLYWMRWGRRGKKTTTQNKSTRNKRERELAAPSAESSCRRQFIWSELFPLCGDSGNMLVGLVIDVKPGLFL